MILFFTAFKNSDIITGFKIFWERVKSQLYKNATQPWGSPIFKEKKLFPDAICLP